jgi:peptidoglycan/xylan/chitin deacetylase (PgdA/CDA1 family)
MKKLLAALFTLFIVLRRIVYIVLGFIDRVLLPRPNLPIILSYHSIANDNWRFSINNNTFKKQINYLYKHYEFITLKEVEEYMRGKKALQKPAIVLTVDDGYKDILKLKPFFDRRNIKPTLFVMSDSRHFNKKQLGTKRAFLTKRDLNMLLKQGWEIGSHSATHPDLSVLSGEQLTKEIIQSKKDIEKLLGIQVRYFAYPRGKYSLEVLKAVKKAKYTLGLTMDDGFITTSSKPLTLPRVGVDRTHSFEEFKNAFTPSVIIARKIIKHSFLGKYL